MNISGFEVTNERAQRASEAFRIIADKSKYERPAAAIRSDTFPMLISSQPLHWTDSLAIFQGSFSLHDSSLLQSIGLFAMYVGDP